jgi:hypothetical protein
LFLSKASVAAGADTSDALSLVATALDRLVARVTQDLDVDASEGVAPDDPQWAATIAGVAAYARECASVLDEPRVFDVLIAE